MALPDLVPAERHRAVAARFGATVASVPDWDAPAPVAGWSARDVVGHLVTWLPAFLGSAGVHLPVAPDVADDPAATWAHHSGAVQALLDDPATAAAELRHPRVPAQPLARAVDAFYTADVFMHTWDLARAAGLDDRLDPALCAAMLDGMVPMEEIIRGSGQYGPRVPVPADADAQTRLLGFIGRDPGWARG